MIPNCEDCIYNTPYIYIEDIDKQAAPEFVDRVVRVHKEKVLPSIKNVLDKNNFIKEWFEKTQLCNIPIYFDKNKNNKYICNNKINICENEEINYNNNNIANDVFNYLGYYIRDHNNYREIRLFEDAFINEARGNEKFLDDLIWKVIIHEYAHAIMDTMYNNIDKLEDQDTVLYKYREESLANAFALRVLKENMNLLSDNSPPRFILKNI